MNFRPETLARIREKMPLLHEELWADGKPLSFFGLLLREDNFNKWDFVVAAPWIDHDKRAALADLARKLNAHLDSDEIMAISRIVTIQSSDPRWRKYNDQFFSDPTGPDLVVVREHIFFDMEMSSAVLFRPSTQIQHAPK